MMFSLNMVLFFNVEKTFHRVMLAILAAFNFLALLHTLSRSSWIGFVIVYMILIFLTKKRTILIFVMIIGLIAAPFILPQIVVERIMYTFGIASEEVTTRHEFILS